MLCKLMLSVEIEISLAFVLSYESIFIESNKKFRIKSRIKWNWNKAWNQIPRYPCECITTSLLKWANTVRISSWYITSSLMLSVKQYTFEAKANITQYIFNIYQRKCSNPIWLMNLFVENIVITFPFTCLFVFLLVYFMFLLIRHFISSNSQRWVSWDTCHTAWNVCLKKK